MLEDDLQLAGPRQPRGDHEVLVAHRQEFTAHHPRQSGPAHQREDDGDPEVDPQRRPVRRQGGAQRHPQRQLRHRHQHLDPPLHHDVDRAAVVPGQAAQQNADQKGQTHPDQADRQRDARPVEDAAEQVAPQIVGPQEKERRLRTGAEQMQIGFEQPPHLVLGTGCEKADRIDLIRIDDVGPLPLPCGRILSQAVHKGAQVKAPLHVEKAHPLRRAQHVLGVPLIRLVRRDELAERRHPVQRQQNHAADQGQPVATKPQPHQPPLRGEGELLFAGLGIAGCLYFVHVTFLTHSGCAGRRSPAECPRSACLLPSAC